ncbi:hypothetical protein FNJ84_13660 [Paracoccus sp. M683]|uniref:hypothetical protein n=1 Tax=Paracoccus sp. M683 TaxID=2594268 RepID=UPI001180E5D9|nr:hypothetical protein [Paracoccus sp. M683]TRW96318.1 hypothetical protein FNJ84_13660 [Paracoccus sp. M683]
MAQPQSSLIGASKPSVLALLGQSNPRPAFYQDLERQYSALVKNLGRLYGDKELAQKIAAEIPQADTLPNIFNFYIGTNHIIYTFIESMKAERKDIGNITAEFPDAKSIAAYLISAEKIPSNKDAIKFGTRLFPSHSVKKSDRAWVVENAPKVSEWLIRDALVYYQIDYEIGGDIALAPVNYLDEPPHKTLIKFFKEVYCRDLKEDFDETQNTDGQRRRRFAPKDGHRTYKQVKLSLHEDLVPVLNAALDGENRNAWIERAIVERLQREGIDFELPEQPSLPSQ